MDIIQFNLSRSPGSYNHFLPLEIGDLTVSIQASSMHYCSPQMNFSSSDHYSEFEVAIFHGDDWFHPERDPRFADTSWAKYWSESDNVAGFVPREEVAQMIYDLNIAFSN